MVLGFFVGDNNLQYINLDAKVMGFQKAGDLRTSSGLAR